MSHRNIVLYNSFGMMRLCIKPQRHGLKWLYGSIHTDCVLFSFVLDKIEWPKRQGAVVNRDIPIAIASFVKFMRNEKAGHFREGHDPSRTYLPCRIVLWIHLKIIYHSKIT